MKSKRMAAVLIAALTATSICMTQSSAQASFGGTKLNCFGSSTAKSGGITVTTSLGLYYGTDNVGYSGSHCGAWGVLPPLWGHALADQTQIGIEAKSYAFITIPYVYKAGKLMPLKASDLTLKQTLAGHQTMTSAKLVTKTAVTTDKIGVSATAGIKGVVAVPPTYEATIGASYSKESVNSQTDNYKTTNVRWQLDSRPSLNTCYVSPDDKHKSWIAFCQIWTDPVKTVWDGLGDKGLMDITLTTTLVYSYAGNTQQPRGVAVQLN